MLVELTFPTSAYELTAPYLKQIANLRYRGLRYADQSFDVDEGRYSGIRRVMAVMAIEDVVVLQLLSVKAYIY
jgi:hypothetical protein